MFLETMIVDLLNRFYVVFCLITVFYYVYVNGCVVVRVEHEAESEEYKYRWHFIFYYVVMQKYRKIV